MESHAFQNVLNQIGITENQIRFESYDSKTGVATLQINGVDEIKVDHHYQLADILNEKVAEITGDETPVFVRGQLHEPFFLIDRNQDGRSDGFQRFNDEAGNWNLKFYGSGKREDKAEINKEYKEFRSHWKQLVKDYKRGEIQVNGLDADSRLEIWLKEAINYYEEYIDSISRSQNPYEAKSKLIAFQVPTYMQLNRIIEVLYDQVVNQDKTEVDISEALSMYETTEANFEARFPFLDAKRPKNDQVDRSFHPGWELYLRNGKRLPVSEYQLNIFRVFFDETGVPGHFSLNGENREMGLTLLSRGGSELMSVRCLSEGDSPLKPGDDMIDPFSVGSEQCALEEPGFDPLRLNETSGFPELPRWDLTYDEKGNLDGINYSFDDDYRPKSLTVDVKIKFDYKGSQPEMINRVLIKLIVESLYPHIRHARATKQAVPILIISPSKVAYDLITENGKQRDQYPGLNHSHFGSHFGGKTFHFRDSAQPIIWINTDINYRYEKKKVQATFGDPNSDDPLLRPYSLEIDETKEVVVEDGSFKGINVGAIELLSRIPHVVYHEADHVDEKHQDYFLDDYDATQQILNLAYQIFSGDMKSLVKYIGLVSEYQKTLNLYQSLRSGPPTYLLFSGDRIEELEKKLDDLTKEREPYLRLIEAYFPSEYAFMALFDFDRSGTFIGFNPHEFNAEIAAAYRAPKPNRVATSAILPDLVRQDICLSLMDRQGLEDTCQSVSNPNQFHKQEWSENPQWFFIRLRSFNILESSSLSSKVKFVFDLSQSMNWDSKELSPKEIVSLVKKLYSQVLSGKYTSSDKSVIELGISEIIINGLLNGKLKEIKPLLEFVSGFEENQSYIQFLLDLSRGQYDEAVSSIEVLELKDIIPNLVEDHPYYSFTISKKKPKLYDSYINGVFELNKNGDLSDKDSIRLMEVMLLKLKEISPESDYDSRHLKASIKNFLSKISKHTLELLNRGKEESAKQWYQSFFPKKKDNYFNHYNTDELRLVNYFDRDYLENHIEIMSVASASSLRKALLSINEPELIEKLDERMRRRFNSDKFSYGDVQYMKMMWNENQITDWVKQIMNDPRTQDRHFFIADQFFEAGLRYQAQILTDFIATPGNQFGDLLFRALGGEDIPLSELKKFKSTVSSIEVRKIYWIIKVYDDQGKDWKVKQIKDEFSLTLYRDSDKHLPNWKRSSLFIKPKTQ